MREDIYTFDCCPFCDKDLPKGPAYFCPFCGEHLDEEFSKRDFFSNVSTSTFDVVSSFDYSYDVEYEDEDDDFDLMSQLREKINQNNESVDTEVSENNSLIDETIEKEETDDSVSEEINNVDDEVQVDSIFDSLNENLEESTNNNQESNQELNKLESTEQENNSNPQKPERNSVELSNENKELKVDLFLKNCVDESIIKKILETKNLKFQGKWLSSFRILAAFELDEILNFTKDTNSNTILEQIYRLDLEALKEYSQLINYDGDDSKISLIKAVVNYFDNDFLLSNATLDNISFRGA